MSGDGVGEEEDGGGGGQDLCRECVYLGCHCWLGSPGNMQIGARPRPPSVDLGAAHQIRYGRKLLRGKIDHTTAETGTATSTSSNESSSDINFAKENDLNPDNPEN